MPTYIVYECLVGNCNHFKLSSMYLVDICMLPIHGSASNYTSKCLVLATNRVDNRQYG